MRAIIIDDKDAQVLLDHLKLAKLELERHRPEGIDNETWNRVVDAAHGKFHHMTCRWLQDQGANLVR